MRRFPGRTLEELDGIDWGRLQRAVQAEYVEQIEQLREQQIAGTVKADKLPEDYWEAIKLHDALIAEDADDGQT